MIVSQMTRKMIPMLSKSINHSVSPGKASEKTPDLKGTITLTLKKKTLHQVYNQVMMCEELGFPNFSKHNFGALIALKIPGFLSGHP